MERPAPTLTPRLITRDSAEAIRFCTTVFGARELERYTSPEGTIVHASVAIGDAVVDFADEAPDWHNVSPKRLGGSPVILSLRVDDPDAVCALAVEHGAKVIFPVADQIYGMRQGRIADPFGHLWILTKTFEDLPTQEIQRRVDDFGSMS